MKVCLVYAPSYKSDCPDYLIGIFETEELAKQAIASSWYSEEDKKELYIDSYDINALF